MPVKATASFCNQRLAVYSQQAKSSPTSVDMIKTKSKEGYYLVTCENNMKFTSVFMNKILVEHGHVHSFCLQLLLLYKSGVVTETVWPTKPSVLTNWLYGRVCGPLL